MRITRTKYIPTLIILSCLLLQACHQVTLVVNGIPENTPPGTVLFVTGNFNYWDPGDQRFALKLNQDSTYSVTLPRGDGTVYYKFTRGDWHSMESDLCGNQMNNRQLRYTGTDTLYVNIESWQDLGATRCDQMTLVVEKVPKSTPPDDSLYVTGTFNNWTDKDPAYRLKKTPGGHYYLHLPRSGAGAIEFKITRGRWENEEVDDYGNLIPNRHFVYGRQDTLRVAIRGWKDIQSQNNDVVTLLVKAPANTPAGDQIYVSTNFNSWYPRDSSLTLMKLPNTDLYMINLPRKVPYVEFKFTRGDWATVECDRYGNDIGNRSFTFGRKDTLRLEIKSWHDLGPAKIAGKP